MKIAGIYSEQSKLSLKVALDKSFHFVFALMAKVKSLPVSRHGDPFIVAPVEMPP